MKPDRAFPAAKVRLPFTVFRQGQRHNQYRCPSLISIFFTFCSTTPTTTLKRFSRHQPPIHKKHPCPDLIIYYQQKQSTLPSGFHLQIRPLFVEKTFSYSNPITSHHNPNLVTVHLDATSTTYSPATHVSVTLSD